MPQLCRVGTLAGPHGRPAEEQLTDLVAGLTANWEVWNESLTDTTGNGHDLSEVGFPTYETINGTALGVRLNRSGATKPALACNSLATAVAGDDVPFSFAVLAVFQNTVASQAILALDNADSSGFHRFYFNGGDEIRQRRDDATTERADDVTDGNYDGSLGLLIFDFDGTNGTIYNDNSALAGTGDNSLAGNSIAFVNMTIGDYASGGLPADVIIAPICFKASGNFSSDDRAAIQTFVDGIYGR